MHFRCVFHWQKAVWGHIQADPNDLKSDFTNRTGVNQLLREICGLPYLPAREIRGHFEDISRRAAGQPRLCGFLSYVRRVWIEGGLWTPERWSIYNRQVRTNNHVEGWHNRLR